ncbi:MAG TPA: hypothetical protein VKG92_10000 [Flavobacteriales bacterium]|nr:hypothetical protein [Flavobacteriales bacterium]
MSFNHIGHKKPLYPVKEGLGQYLAAHGRSLPLPLAYDELHRFDSLMPQYNASGKETLWNTVLLRPSEQEEMHQRLVETYQVLIADGRHIEHLQVAGIDLCPYGNSQPFRIKILNKINDNHDYYYIKRTDASRVYGLELEHLLSPNRINYLVEGDTLVEEHIIGVPGDSFITEPARYGGVMNEVRLSKEFVKFNERCFVRLLGDMRAYNFVVDVIHDLDQVQYRIRSIDFDQQSYEGRMRIYLPQFYKENIPYVRLAQAVIGPETADQYRNEERSLLRRRYKLAQEAVEGLLAVMRDDPIAPPENLNLLAGELARHHSDGRMERCTSMGELLALHLLACLGAGRA